MSFDKVIVALDFSSATEALKIVDDLEGLVDFFKVGYELFLAEGFSFLNILKKRNKRIFLDLKLHDIPTTVYKATKLILNYQVEMFTIHTLGGVEMMKASLKALREIGEVPSKIIGVTVLTSLNEEKLYETLNTSFELNNLVLHLATRAYQSGLHGVVASANEAKKIKELCGKDFLVITPAIRAEKMQDDQRRIS
ncbi:MAG: orotidine-5'-phosphate decarboxylase, partial [Thermodesulfovibrionaceae bacterium]